MPLYEFECCKCNLVFEVLCSYNESREVKCESCGKVVERLMSACAFKHSVPQDSDRWANSHDYRFGYKLEDSREERKQAEKKSHMGSGSEIYKNIDDTKYVGEMADFA